MKEFYHAWKDGAERGRRWAARREEKRLEELKWNQEVADMDPAGREHALRIAYYKKLLKWCGWGLVICPISIAAEPTFGMLVTGGFATRIGLLVHKHRQRQRRQEHQQLVADMVPSLNQMREILSSLPVSVLEEEPRDKFEVLIARLAGIMAQLGAPRDGLEPQEVLASHEFTVEGLQRLSPQITRRLFFETIPVEMLHQLPGMPWSVERFQRAVSDLQESVDFYLEEGLKRHGFHVYGYPAPIPGVFEWKSQRAVGIMPNHDYRFQHVITTGKTGYGKSVLERNDVLQNLANNYVEVVISHESNFFEERVLPYYPESRKEELIYWNPADTRPPIVGIGAFALDRREHLDLVAGELYTTLARAMGDVPTTAQPVTQNAIYALLEVTGSTWTTFERLIKPSEDAFRKTFVKHPNLDERTRKFWQEYTKATYYHVAYDPIMNRLGPFFRPPLLITLSTPSFSFDQHLNRRRGVLFCDLSQLRGIMQETVARLIIALVHQTFAARDYLPEDQWRPAALHIDEFQRYATGSQRALEEFLTGIRKYRAYLSAVFQTTANLPNELVRTIFGNVGTIRCFQLSAYEAPVFAKELRLMERVARPQGPEFAALERAIAQERLRLAEIRAPSSQILESLIADYRRAQKAAMFVSEEDAVSPSLRPDILETLPRGFIIMKGVPEIEGPASLAVPELPPWLPENTRMTPQELIDYSKQRYGIIPSQNESQPSEDRDDDDEDGGMASLVREA